MRHRAIKDLCSLSDDKLFPEISTGLGHILKVVDRLQRSIRRLPGSGQIFTRSIHSHAAHILGALTEEEAAKFLILLDFVRCPRTMQKKRPRQLGYFYDHLAKGIYAEYCSWHPADFAEVTRLVNSSRQAFYLDGPLGVDWIYYNNILSEREDRLYVNYERDDEDNSDWYYPREFQFGFGYRAGTVIHIVKALDAVGMTSAEGLAVVAEIWRRVKIKSELTIGELIDLNHRTLRNLEDRGLLSVRPVTL